MNRQKEHHDSVKKEALALWNRLDAPVYDSPMIPEAGFSSKAIEMAKRGRRCVEETAVCGSTKTRKSIRDFERSAARHGSVEEEVIRLSEYPVARERYLSIMNHLRQRNDLLK